MNDQVRFAFAVSLGRNLSWAFEKRRSTEDVNVKLQFSYSNEHRSIHNRKNIPRILHGSLQQNVALFNECIDEKLSKNVE